MMELYRENIKQLLAFNYFRKKAPSYMFDKVINMHWGYEKENFLSTWLNLLKLFLRKKSSTFRKVIKSKTLGEGTFCVLHFTFLKVLAVGL